MRKYFDDGIQKLADENKLKPTKTELLIKPFLENGISGCYFEFQAVLAKFIPDFVCWQNSLVIEIDGSDHRKGKRLSDDKYKDKLFKGLGYRVLRITNKEIYKDLDGVLEKIRNWIVEPDIKPTRFYANKGISAKPIVQRNKLCLSCQKVLPLCMVHDKCIKCRGFHT